MAEVFDVVIAACDSYDADIKSILKNALDNINGLDFIKPGMTVGIKANLVSSMKPEKAATTHPRLISALCDILIEHGVSQVIIGDSPGGLYNSAFLSHVYSSTGMKLLENDKVRLNNDFSTELVSVKDAKVIHSFTCTAWLKKVDAIINFSKLKTHGMMGMSAAVKNLFGTVPGTMKAEYHSLYPNHRNFAEMLVDLNVYWKSELNICDAVIGMEGNGPTAGTPRHIGAILASKSPYMLDFAASKIIGLTPDEAPTLGCSIARGLTPDSIEKIRISGDPNSFYISDFQNIADRKNLDFSDFGKTPFNKKLYKLAGVLTRSKPYTYKKECIGCGKCAELCPRKTIRIVRKKAVIDRKNCIRCFCCQEFCPVGAMKAKRSFIGKLLVK